MFAVSLLLCSVLVGQDTPTPRMPLLDIEQVLAQAQTEVLDLESDDREAVLEYVTARYAQAGKIDEALSTIAYFTTRSRRDIAIRTIASSPALGTSVDRALEILETLDDESHKDLLRAAIGSRLASEGQVEKAQELCDTIADPDQNEMTRIAIARALAKARKIDEAMAMMESIERQTRSYVRSQIAIGRASGGDIKGAIAMLDDMDSRARIAAPRQIALLATKAGEKALAAQLLTSEFNAIKSALEGGTGYADAGVTDAEVSAADALWIAQAQAINLECKNAVVSAKLALKHSEPGKQMLRLECNIPDLVEALVNAEAVSEALEVCDSAGDVDLAIFSLCEVALQQIKRGKIKEAGDIKVKAIKLFQEMDNGEARDIVARSLARLCGALGDRATLVTIILPSWEYELIDNAGELVGHPLAEACEYQARFGGGQTAMAWANECKEKPLHAYCLAKIASGAMNRKDDRPAK